MTSMGVANWIHGAPVKYSKHIVITTRPVTEAPRKSFRIVFTDPDATDSSDDEEAVRRRIKKHVSEIWFDATPPSQKEAVEKSAVKQETGSSKGFQGVRRRFSDRIRDLKNRKRVWLRKFNKAEQAAAKYHEVAKRLYGVGAVTNFAVKKQNAVAVAQVAT